MQSQFRPILMIKNTTTNRKTVNNRIILTNSINDLLLLLKIKFLNCIPMINCTGPITLSEKKKSAPRYAYKMYSICGLKVEILSITVYI